MFCLVQVRLLLENKKLRAELLELESEMVSNQVIKVISNQ